METILMISTLIILLGIASAWNGLARRHLRLVLDSRQIDLHLRGVGAVLVGALGVLVAAFGAKIALPLLGEVSSRCGGSITCAAQAALIPFTNWLDAIFLLCSYILFIM